MIKIIALFAGISILSTFMFLSSELTNQDTLNISRGISSDGYVYESQQFRVDSASIQVIRFDSYEALTEYVNKTYDKKYTSLLGGYTIMYSNRKKSMCIIHIVDPAIEYRPEYIGHEFTHCIDGNFHKNQ